MKSEVKNSDGKSSFSDVVGERLPAHLPWGAQEYRGTMWEHSVQGCNMVSQVLE